MTALLWVLHGAFWTPFGVRYLRTGLRPTPAGGADSRRETLPLIVHSAALAVVYAGLVLATLGVAGAVSHGLLAVVGTVLIGAAALLVAWTLAVFRSWRARAALARDHTLCTRGPFRLSRHPIYAALGLLAVGSCCVVLTPWTIGGTLAALLAGDRRARLEEELLRSAYGGTYDAYARGVRRFVPWVY